jgi:dynamin 1-like protein
VDEDEDFAVEQTPTTNGITARDGRAVSSTVHDRARTASAIPTGAHVKSASRRHQHEPPQRPQSQPSGSPPHTARETFLNYFFGQNGPGPLTGTNLERSQSQSAHGDTVVPTGRDVYGSAPSMNSGLMAGRRSMDGNDAAYDMKSLGKHIEAVCCLLTLHAAWI